MKKITLTLAAIFGLSSLAQSQDLYVSDNSYMYVQDEIVFVNDDIRLDTATSNLYLRGDGQLIQNTNTKNSDAGELSVYQRQTGDIYDYSYWCSPVGVSAEGLTKEDTNFNVTNFHQPASTTINEIVSATYGVSPYGYDSSATQIKTYWLWQVVNAYSYNQWGHFSTLLSGRGFTMKGSPTADNIIDFRGRPNTGDISVPCIWNGSSVAQTDYDGLSPSQVESLTGNPYPSAMDLKLLFVDPANMVGHNRNTFLEQAVYFWEENQNVDSHYLADYEGGYAMYTPGDLTDDTDDGDYTRATWKKFHVNGNGGGVGSDNGGGVGFSENFTPNHSRRYAAIGQGFMIRNIDGNVGGNAIINNSMRVYLAQDNAFNGDGSVFKTSETTDEETKAMSHNGLDYMHIVNNPKIIPRIRIHTLINDTYYRESLLAFRANTNLNFKPGCDGRIAQKLATDAYLLADNNELSVKSIEYNIDAKIPYGAQVANNESEFIISVGNLDNVSESIEIFMHDKLTDTYTDIRNGTFEVTLDAGTHNDRFEVVFRNAATEDLEEELITEEEVTSSFNVYQNNTNNVLTIKNPKAYIVKSFMMYDVTGKVIYNKQNLGNNETYTFPTNSLSNGMYLTKVVTDQDFEITKKVMVQN